MARVAALAALGLLAAAARAELAFTAESYGAGFVQGLRDRSVFNPDNAYLGLPSAGALLDLRPRLSYEAGPVLARLEPRARLRYDDAQEPGTGQRSDGEAELFLTQAYLEIGLGAHLRVRGGVQNYQWGPAELLAPSNPFFQAKPAEQGFLFEQRGRTLLRLDLNPTNALTLSAAGEVADNGEDEPIAGRGFEPRFLVRADYLVPGTLSSFGVTGGRAWGTKPFSAFYGTYYASDALSVYVDALQSYGDPTLRPFVGNMGLVFREDEKRGTQHVVTGGLRFEGRADARLEYVYNGWGLSKDEFNAVGDAFVASQSPSGVASPAAALALPALLASGRDLHGRHYLYASLRVADWPRDAASTTTRFLVSLEEASLLAQLAYEQGLGERWTAFVEPTLFLGGRGSRQAALQRYLVTAGLKLSI